MSKYSPLVSFETEFEGDKVTMQLDQLTRAVFLSWTPFMREMDAKGNLNEENTIKLVSEAATILPQFVRDFRGLKDADGNAITIETIVDKIYFIELVSQIVMRLIENAQIGKGKEVEKVAVKSAGALREASAE